MYAVCVCAYIYFELIGVICDNLRISQEGSCIITGISYEHKKSDHEAGEGSVGWHALTNVNVIDFETSIHLEAMVESFNLNTNRWMSWYVCVCMCIYYVVGMCMYVQV